MPETFLALKSLADLQNLVDQGIEESLYLDYKASAALSRQSEAISELCKDVTALANSAGGQIVYGIEEDKARGKPKRLDEGVSDPKITREWIVQILNSRVQPRIDGLRVERIPLSDDDASFAYVITVQPTHTGPHQAPDKKYYRRFELHSEPMNDYEIRDVQNRSAAPSLVVTPTITKLTRSLEYEGLALFRLHFEIENLSRQPAYYTLVTIGVSPDIEPRDPAAFQRFGTETSDDGHRLHLLRVQLGIPDFFPFFQGAKFNITPNGGPRFSVQSPQINSRFMLRIKVQTPGFDSVTDWEIRKQADNMSLKELAPL